MSNRGYAARHGMRTGVWITLICAFLCICALLAYVFLFRDAAAKQDDAYAEAFHIYIAHIEAGEYAQAYSMLTQQSKLDIDEETFVTRYENIYAGIEARNLELETVIVEELGETISGTKGARKIIYRVHLDTVAGPLTFSNETQIYAYKPEKSIQFQLDWNYTMLFPGLGPEDRVSVKQEKGERGNLYDRNGVMLAGAGIVKEVGFIPGKMNADSTADITAVSEILDMSVEAIERRLSAKWVKDDLFVPLSALSEQDIERKEQLLQIKGILIRDATDRVYPLAEAAAHLTGYMQQINAEELEVLAGEGYHANSKLGKLGLENLLESRIRGIDGCNISILDSNGAVKTVVVDRPAVHGEHVTLTIDSVLQQQLYNSMQEEKGTAVVIQPYTGEVLALISTPAYDPNAFILGVGETLWQQWQEDARRPLYNRFKATYCPGSMFKPIVAGIGITTGVLMSDDNLGYHGRSWKKDDSWGGYQVTTLQEYGNDVTMRNALVYSDNIYFAKAALRLGETLFASELRRLGFGEQIPFLFGMSASSFGTDMAFSSEIELADSGYGQGKMLVNPLHIAMLYAAFLNDGDIPAPQLEYGAPISFWKQGGFSSEAAKELHSDLIQIVEDPDGTAHEVKTDGLTIGGKTGTAEIKASQNDETGTELGWFAGFCQENALLFVGMIEDVKGRGGSHYVLPIGKAVLAREGV